MSIPLCELCGKMLLIGTQLYLLIVSEKQENSN